MGRLEGTTPPITGIIPTHCPSLPFTAFPQVGQGDSPHLVPPGACSLPLILGEFLADLYQESVSGWCVTGPPSGESART